MAASVRSKKVTTVDKRIEEFCRHSKELLAAIQSRCSVKGKTKKPGRAKQKRKTKPGKKSN